MPENIGALRKTRMRLVQEEYAQIMGQDQPIEFYSDEEIDLDRYKKVKEILEQKREYIDSLISKYSPKRPVPLINKPDLAVLRVAIAETFLGKLVPVKVGINEAVEIAKRFGTQQSYKFINGVLGSMLREEFSELLEQTQEQNQLKKEKQEDNKA